MRAYLRLPGLLALLLLASLVSAPAHADESLVEPATNHAFPNTLTRDGRKMALLGVGVRKKFFVKVYGIGLYVDDSEARRAFPALSVRAGGRDHAKVTAGDHAQSFVLWGTFNKLAVLHMVHDVDAAKMRGAYEEGLIDELSPSASPDLRAAAQAFILLFDTDLKVGDDLLIGSSADGTLSVEIGGKKKVGPQNAKLARAVWNVWLGPKAISADLRRDLVSHIELLGQ